MTDRQDKPTASLREVCLYSGLAATAFCGSIWAGLGSADDSHELAGLALGLLATAFLLCEAIAAANTRARAWAERRNEESDNTGIWESPDGTKRFTVRWAPGEEAYYVQGHLGGYLFYPDEQRWPQKPRLLTEVIRGLEHIDSWRWIDDAPTRTLRARLGLSFEEIDLGLDEQDAGAQGWNNARNKPGPY